MAVHFRYLFIVCFIMGFYIDVPVTMFPSNADHVPVSDDVGLHVVGKGLVCEHQAQEKNKRDLRASNRANDFVKSQPASQKHLRSDIVIGSKSFQNLHVYSEVNQPHQVGLPEFNNPNSLNRFNTDFVSKSVQSSTSILNNVPRDLRSVNLDQIQERLENLTTILQFKKRLLDVNAMPSAVKKTQINQDSSNSIHDSKMIQLHKFSMARSDKGNATNNSNDVRNIPVHGVTWARNLEERCPNGFPEHECVHWKTKVFHSDILKIEPGCGSMQNRLVTFSDSSKACVRYRLNSDQMQGEIYSYYLSKLLGMNYIPPTLLHIVEHSQQWRLVWEDVVAAGWSQNKPIIFTKWAESLQPVYMPDELKDNERKLQLENYRFSDTAQGDLCGLLQWTDLIVFDYVTANLDRVVNNMANLKWNHKMLEKPIHNLEKSRQSGQLIWIDNESGLFHSYRLLDNYQRYHQNLLDSVCIFRQSTIDAVEWFHHNGNIGEQLQQLYEKNEQLHGHLPRMPFKNMQILQSRIEDVYKQMTLCKQRYNSMYY